MLNEQELRQLMHDTPTLDVLFPTDELISGLHRRQRRRRLRQGAIAACAAVAVVSTAPAALDQLRSGTGDQLNTVGASFATDGAQASGASEPRSAASGQQKTSSIVLGAYTLDGRAGNVIAYLARSEGPGANGQLLCTNWIADGTTTPDAPATCTPAPQQGGGPLIDQIVPLTRDHVAPQMKSQFTGVGVIGASRATKPPCPVTATNAWYAVLTTADIHTTALVGSDGASYGTRQVSGQDWPMRMFVTDGPLHSAVARMTLADQQGHLVEPTDITLCNAASARR